MASQESSVGKDILSFAKIRSEPVEGVRSRKIVQSMAPIFLYLFRVFFLLGSGQHAIALENLALGRGTVRSTRDTVRSETTIPSIFSSPWILGAPHVGFAVAI